MKTDRQMQEMMWSLENSRFIVETTDADVEAGYPEFRDNFYDSKGCVRVLLNASKKGIPPHRLTVTQVWIDDNAEYQTEDHGCLEEFLDD